jgi:transcription initiation factor TFIIB
LDIATQALSLDRFGNITREILNTPLAYHDMGLSTSISISKTDAHGVSLDSRSVQSLHRMRQLNKFSTNRSRQRNYASAFMLLNNIKDKLHLTDSVVQQAAHNYRKAVELRMAKGRSIKALVVASTFAACRDMNNPKTIEEIARAVDADPAFAARCFRLLARNLKRKPQRIGLETYVSRIVSIARIKGKVYPTAVDIVRFIKDKHVAQGKNPRALAAAAVFLACEIEGQEIRQAEIANAGDVSIVSLRKRIADIRSVYDCDKSLQSGKWLLL